MEKEKELPFDDSAFYTQWSGSESFPSSLSFSSASTSSLPSSSSCSTFIFPSSSNSSSISTSTSSSSLCSYSSSSTSSRSSLSISIQQQSSLSSSSSSSGSNVESKRSSEESKDSSPTIADLGEEQLYGLELFENGGNVCFMGAAGSGKSLVTRIITKALMEAKIPTAVTATTGIAAINIGGMTFHRYARCGIFEDPASVYIARIKKDRIELKKWQELRVLVIDEISMFHCDLLDKVEEIIRAVRGNDLPMGGVQLLFVGDPYQIPPVNKNPNIIEPYFFKAKCWPRLFPVGHAIDLRKVYRQKPSDFLTSLNQMRLGIVTKKTDDMMSARVGVEPDTSLGIKPTKIFGKNVDVDTANANELFLLSGKEYIYTPDDWGRPEYLINPYKKPGTTGPITWCNGPDSFRSKDGAQCMLVSNHLFDDGVANGSRCVILRHGKMSQINEEMESKEKSNRQDMVSRETNVAQMEQEESFNRVHPDMEWPFVRFLNGFETWIIPFAYELKKDKVLLARRVMIPLVLAWSLTGHKVQGMTLDYGETAINKINIFEAGMAYTILSRLRTIEGLFLLDWDPKSVRCSKAVTAFVNRETMQMTNVLKKRKLESLREQVKAKQTGIPYVPKPVRTELVFSPSFGLPSWRQERSALLKLICSSSSSSSSSSSAPLYLSCSSSSTPLSLSSSSSTSSTSSLSSLSSLSSTSSTSSTSSLSSSMSSRSSSSLSSSNSPESNTPPSSLSIPSTSTTSLSLSSLYKPSSSSYSYSGQQLAVLQKEIRKQDDHEMASVKKRIKTED